MNFSYIYKIHKKIILSLLSGILIFIILSQIYYLFNYTVVEGIKDPTKKYRDKAKDIANDAGKTGQNIAGQAEEEARQQAEAAARQAEETKRQAEEAARQAEEEARKQAEEAAKKAEEEARKQAEEAARLAEQQLLELENVLNKLLKPIKDLKNVAVNSLSSLTNF